MKQKDPEISVFMRKNSIYLALAVIIVLGAWWVAERSQIQVAVDYSQSGAATYDCEVKKQSCLKKAFTAKKRAACEKTYSSCLSASSNLDSVSDAIKKIRDAAIEQRRPFSEVTALASSLGLEVQSGQDLDGTMTALIKQPETGSVLVAISDAYQTNVVFGNSTGKAATCSVKGTNDNVRVLVWPNGALYGLGTRDYTFDFECNQGDSSAQCLQGRLAGNAVVSLFNQYGGASSLGGEDRVVLSWAEQAPEQGVIGQARSFSERRQDSTFVTTCRIEMFKDQLQGATTIDIMGLIQHEMGHCFGFGHQSGDGFMSDEEDEEETKLSELTTQQKQFLKDRAAGKKIFVDNCSPMCEPGKVVDVRQQPYICVDAAVICGRDNPDLVFNEHTQKCESCPEGQVAINGKCEIKPICYPPLVYSPSTNLCAYQNQDILGDGCTYQFGPGGEYYRTCSLLGGAKEVCYREAYGIAEKCVYVPGSSGGSFGGGGDLFQLDFQGGAGFFDYLKTIETCTQNPSQPGCDSF